MTLRTLLLGSAAAFLTVGAAQAADLGAEPANYVKVCDAFGPGFYYAPGTDTCIKIGGYVFLDVNIYADNTATSGTNNWMYKTEAQVNVTASSMTEYGPLVGYLQITAAGGSPGPGATSALGPAVIDGAFLSLGPLLAGYTWSIYNPVFLGIDGGWNFTGNTRNNQIRLSWAASGFGFSIAAEDPASRYVTNVTNMPDITAALDTSLSGIGLHLGGGYGNRSNGGNVYGVNGNARLGAGPLNLLIGASYSSGGNDWVSSFLPALFGGFPGTGFDGNNYLSIFGSVGVALSSQLNAAVYGGYQTRNGANTANIIIGNVTFSPVKNFSVAGEVVAAQGNGVATITGATAWTTTGKIRLRRDFP